MTSFELHYLFKDPTSKYSPILRYWGLGLMNSSGYITGSDRTQSLAHRHLDPALSSAECAWASGAPRLACPFPGRLIHPSCGCQNVEEVQTVT